MVNVGDGVADLMADVALQEGERMEEVAIQQPDIVLSLSIVALCTSLVAGFISATMVMPSQL